MNSFLNELTSIMQKMDEINYGFVDNGKNIYPDDDKNWENSFSSKYHLQSPEELLENKYGVCWDQVELERYYLEKENINCRSFFIIAYDHKIYPTHTFMVVENNNKYYWLEHSWEPYRGIHEFNNLEELLNSVKNKFLKTVKEKKFEVVIYQYSKPIYGLNCIDFIHYCENSEKIGC